MSCRCYERWIALFVEGDLPPRKSRRLEEHLASCERCGELLHGLEESQASVKALAEVALPSSVLQEMRQAVREGIDAGAEAPRSNPGWIWALAGSVAVLVLGLVIFFRAEAPEPERAAEVDPVETAPVTPPEVEPSPPVEVERSPEPEPVPVPKTRVADAEPAPAKPTGEDMVVRIMTDNPDVVIYWLIEQNGG